MIFNQVNWPKKILKGSIGKEIFLFLQDLHIEVYLVGGYVRDWLLRKFSRDLDFAVKGDAIKLARIVANRFGGSFFPLDEERDTGRAILRDKEGIPFFVDFARLRGESIEEDLSLRDFTINAIAVDVKDPKLRLIDPYNGCEDIRLGVIRATSDSSFREDPLRTLRAVRLAAELGMDIEPKTESLLREAVPLIESVSPERIRDEFVKTMACEGAAEHLRRLDGLGLLKLIIPEIEHMKGVEQSPPHYLDVFEHSLETVKRLEGLVESLPPLLSPFSSLLLSHFAQTTSGEHKRFVLLKLVAFLHDVEKPSTKGVDEEGCIHFFDHEGKGAKVIGEILKRLRFSRGEVKLACTIVANHMRPSELAAQEVITKRDSYRFFRDTGDAGVDTLLLYLADHLATWGPNLIQERWQKRVEAVASLLTDYYMERIISPPKLIGGSDLMEEFALEEGPLIGRLLEEVREAQVMGEVKTREEALEYARSLLRKMESNGSESGSKTVSFARI